MSRFLFRTSWVKNWSEVIHEVSFIAPARSDPRLMSVILRRQPHSTRNRMTTRNARAPWRLPRPRIGYSHDTMTNDDRMQRESSLIATIRKKLPDFAKACADFVRLHSFVNQGELHVFTS
jgi:hypothetical protein